MAGTKTSRQSGATRAARNRKLRQDNFREQMRAYGVWSQILELNKKLGNLDEELDSVEVQRIKASLDSHHKMLDKFVSQAPTETINDHNVAFPDKIKIQLVKSK